MKTTRTTIYVCDFETVVEDDTSIQEETEVWAWACAKLFDGTEDVSIGNDIDTFFEHVYERNKKVICYFHNLKFDASFIMAWAFANGYTNAYDETKRKFKDDKNLKNKEIAYCISDMGQWYTVTLKYKGCLLEFRDSLKLLPFSIEALGKAFDTKYRKLTMDYVGHKHKGEVFTEEEIAYIKNDILVPKEALEKFLSTMGYTSKIPITIASMALNEYKKINDFNSPAGKKDFEELFPNLSEFKLDPDIYGSDNADSYTRQSYFGGWCYAKYDRKNRVQGKSKHSPNKCIKVYDVNSLYPSVMSEAAGLKYPVGVPHFFSGTLPQIQGKYFFIRFRCNFKLKEGALPFIQIKHDTINFFGNENLDNSYYDKFGEYVEGGIRPEMTLSETMFVMFKKCYNIYDFELLDGCYFDTMTGIFGSYIDKYFKMKQGNNDNKVLRSAAKLMLNSLYGKFGTNPESCFKYMSLDPEGEIVEGIDIRGEDKKPLFVPIASAVTSYAKAFTLRAAIENKKNFLYSDTDSIHLLMDRDEEPNYIKVHDTNLLSWKHEATFDNGIYIRQKTYFEYSESEVYIAKDGKEQKGVYDVKACGLSEKGKSLFIHSIRRTKPDKYSKEEEAFLKTPRKPTDFEQGLTIPGNLEPKTIKGGTVLVERSFTVK